MARGRKGLGVEPLATSIRFSFTLNGEQVRETVQRAPTPANLKWASRHAADVRRAIDAGTFERDYREFFPDSKRAARATGATTLAEFCKLFLSSITDKSANTKAQYRNALAWWQKQLGADTPVADIRHSALKALWGSHPWASWKLANNYLIPLRGVFALAVGDGLVAKSPVDGLVNKRRPPSAKEPPDPFTPQEETAILRRLAVRAGQVFNYFDFAFATGMRPEELIELRWADVDFNTEIARVTRARSLGEVRQPKNGAYRDVELNRRAVACLLRQKPFTAMREHG
ncbi:MAG: Arm DNA-binding domain-containing protein, partial [Usitatibacter sp.]